MHLRGARSMRNSRPEPELENWRIALGCLGLEETILFKFPFPALGRASWPTASCGVVIDELRFQVALLRLAPAGPVWTAAPQGPPAPCPAFSPQGLDPFDRPNFQPQTSNLQKRNAHQFQPPLAGLVLRATANYKYRHHFSSQALLE
jgi:hypothetical protein